jgi:hypothetical protein
MKRGLAQIDTDGCDVHTMILLNAAQDHPTTG